MIFSVVAPIFQNSMVAKLVLLFSLYGIGPLLPHLAHHPLVISALSVIHLVEADVDGAKRPTPPNTSTAVNQNGVWLWRVGCTHCRCYPSLDLGLANSKDKMEDAGATGGNPVVWPRQELEVNHCSLLSLHMKEY